MDVVSKLKIMDIALWESHLSREVEYPNIENESALEYQTMRKIRVDLVGASLDGGEQVDILKVFVSLGIRCVRPTSEPAAPEVLHSLESVFAVEYERVADLDDSEIEDFARFNSVHNVWPFWRQHVYETLKKASLPVPEVPFFAGRTSLEQKGHQGISKNVTVDPPL